MAIDPMSAGAAGLGAGLGFYGTVLTNKSNRQSVDATNAMNMQIAEAQMAFQERMANTAHQREVKDLLAAGLNPILSATGGAGAPSPGGAAATMTPFHAENSAKALGDGLQSFAQLTPQLQNVAADTAVKAENAKLLAIQRESSAKDVEMKGIENAHRATILGQQIKKGGLDISHSDRTLVDRIVQESNKAALGTLQTKGETLSNAQRSQALKYDYYVDKALDRQGVAPDSAKKSGESKSLMDRVLDAGREGAHLLMRRYLGGKK